MPGPIPELLVTYWPALTCLCIALALIVLRFLEDLGVLDVFEPLGVESRRGPLL
jgi:hypothetical protein